MSQHFDHLASEFQMMLAGAIRDMKDPRISAMTTVSHMELARDLKTCKVFISVYDEDNAKRQQTVDILNRAQAAVGRNVNQHMRIRRIPKLTFILDKGIEQSAHISKILDSMAISPAKPEEGGE